MAILLIRHGETEGNRTRVIQRPEIPLSEGGRAQAARLADRLRDSPIDEIWTSPLARARMTTDALERALAAPVRVEDDLQERNLGDLRGTAYADLDLDPFAPDYRPPGGESWEDFYDRVDRMWSRIEQHWNVRYASRAPDRHLAVVSHGLFLRSLIERRLLSREARESHEREHGPFRLGNTALTIVVPMLEAPDGPAHRIELLGCTAHLDEEPLGDVGTLSVVHGHEGAIGAE